MPTTSHHLGSLPNGMVCRLRRCLYGPKQTPRACFERFVSVVIAASFWRVLIILHFRSTIQFVVEHFFYMSIITGYDSKYIALVKARGRTLLHADHHWH